MPRQIIIMSLFALMISPLFVTAVTAQEDPGSTDTKNEPQLINLRDQDSEKSSDQSKDSQINIRNNISDQDKRIQDTLRLQKSGLAETEEKTLRLGATSTERLQNNRGETLDGADKLNRLSEIRKARIKAYFERMIIRLDVAFLRLENLINRIESRIEKLEENNKNIETAESKRYLEEAKQHLEGGSVILASIPNMVDDLVNSDLSPRQKFIETRSLIKEVVSKLKTAHESIKNAIRSIKAQVEPTDNSTDPEKSDVSDVSENESI